VKLAVKAVEQIKEERDGKVKADNNRSCVHDPADRRCRFVQGRERGWPSR